MQLRKERDTDGRDGPSLTVCMNQRLFLLVLGVSGCQCQELDRINIVQVACGKLTNLVVLHSASLGHWKRQPRETRARVRGLVTSEARI